MKNTQKLFGTMLAAMALLVFTPMTSVAQDYDYGYYGDYGIGFDDNYDDDWFGDYYEYGVDDDEWYDEENDLFEWEEDDLF